MIACLSRKSVWLEKDARILTSAPYPNQESALEKWESISCRGSVFHSANLGEEQLVGGRVHTMRLVLFANLPATPHISKPGHVHTSMWAKHLSKKLGLFRRFIIIHSIIFIATKPLS